MLIHGSKSGIVVPPGWMGFVVAAGLGAVGSLIGIALARWMRVARRFLFVRLAAGQAVCWLLAIFHVYWVAIGVYGARSPWRDAAIGAALLLVPWSVTVLALRGATPKARFVNCVVLTYVPMLVVAGLPKLVWALVR